MISCCTVNQTQFPLEIPGDSRSDTPLFAAAVTWEICRQAAKP